MGDKSSIEWCDATWNPTVGCSRVSEGCKNCYAFSLHDMRHKAYMEGKKLPKQYAKPFKEVQTFEDRLVMPLKWKRPRKIFVNSLSDLFHKDIPDHFIWNVFHIMAKCPQHTFQVLTKRPERMMRMFKNRYWRDFGDMRALVIEGQHRETDMPFLPNVWLGTSVENQQSADDRILPLLATPAVVRFLSCEPLLGPVNLSMRLDRYDMVPGIDWIIVGGESGPKARPMQQEWLISLRDQCEAEGVPFFFKQWGEWVPFNQAVEMPQHPTKAIKTDDVTMWRVGKYKAGRLLDGVEWNEFPEVTI